MACRRHAVGRADVFRALAFGEASDTFSANPLCCAAVLATLDIFEGHDILGSARRSSAIIEEGLLALKALLSSPTSAVRRTAWSGASRSMHGGGRTASEIARACVLAAYRGDGDGRAIHIMGPLATRVLRIAPPLTITEAEARESIDVLTRCLQDLMSQLSATSTATSASTGA